jgi:copper chaperone CopZ
MTSSMMRRMASGIVTLLVLGACAKGGGERSAGSATTARPAAANPTGAADSAGMPVLVNLEIGGMTCQGCVARVQKQLEGVPGVHRVDIRLDQQRAVVLADPSVRDTALTGAVRRAGSEYLGLVVKR